MKHIKLITFVFLLFHFWSCKKQKYPESIVDNEVSYYAQMEVDGQPLVIKAGENDYYMYSEFRQDSNRVYNFVSNLRNSVCGNCTPELEFQLNDVSDRPLNASIISDSAFRLGQRAFEREGRGPFYTVEFSGRYNRSALTSNYSWDFGKGVEGSGVTISKTFEFAGPYSVCLRVKGTSGCESTNCNLQNFSPGALRVNINSIAGSGDTVKFAAQVAGGKPPYSYVWNFGDGSILSGEKVSHVYSVRGAYGVVIMVRDANGNSVSANYNAITANDPSGCAANYSITSVQTSTNGIQNWGKAGIRLRMSDGNLYSSRRTDQPSDSQFEILSATPAGTNEKGETIYKVKVRYAATLFNGTKFIQIKNGEAVIAVAYK